jgi:hypothetical protein
VPEHLLDQLRRHAGARVADGHAHGVVLGGEPDLHPPGPGGVERVVDEVAQHGDQIGGEFRVPVRVDRVEPAAGRQPQFGAALGGQARLRHQQRGHRGVPDAGGDLAAPLVRPRDDPRDEPPHLVVLAQLREPGDRVQAVRELVRLRPQGVGDVTGGVEAVLQRRQFRAIPERDDGADGGAVDHHRHPVEHEHAGAVQHDLVGAGRAAGEDVQQPVVQAEVAHPGPDGVDPEQLARRGVEQRDPVGPVQPEHTLLHTEQHRLPPLHELHDLCRFEAEGLAAHAPGEQQRPGHPEHDRDPHQRHRGPGCGQEPGEQRRRLGPRRHEPDDPPVVGEHRHLRDDRAPVRVAHPRPAGGRGAPADRERLPDLGGIGRAAHHEVGVHDHDLVGARQVARAGAERGQRAEAARREALPHARGRRDVLGHRQHPPALRLAERGIRLHDGQGGDGGEQQPHDPELPAQELPCERPCHERQGLMSTTTPTTDVRARQTGSSSQLMLCATTDLDGEGGRCGPDR